MDHRRRGEIPWFAAALSRIVQPINHLFDWLYHSRYNPLYRSGTLAVGLLLILLVSGTYLVLFYSVSTPYESVVQIEGSVWLGRWMRSIHRYATTAAVIAVIFHILQLLVQAKSWGPRLLAWISGMILFGALFISAWSGYVMVWDRQGQEVALRGAEVLGATLPFLRDVLAGAFDGSEPLAGAFFFMNLFLHVALPLGMIFGLWVHTAKLARSVWFPTRRIMWGTFLVLGVLALLWPAPLLEKADLLSISGRIPIDLSTNFFLPLVWRFGAGGTTALWGVLALIGFSMPFWWRPRKADRRPLSVVDEGRCTGCTQCVHDCPYEAISMIPHHAGKRLLAQVAPESCVSCGLCAASCGDLAIGPPGRTGEDQIAYAKALLSTDKGPFDICAVTCIANTGVETALRKFAEKSGGIAIWPVDCCAAVHSQMIESILEYAGGVFMVGCPERNCRNRDGMELLTGRIFERRLPFLARSVDRNRLRLAACSGAETTEILESLADFQSGVKAGTPNSGRGVRPLGAFQLLRLGVATIVLAATTALISQIPFGTDPNNGLLRLSGRLPSAHKQLCRPPTAEEIAAIPIHMRQQEICEATPLRYQTVVTVDGVTVDNFASESAGRTDRPVRISRDLELASGAHSIVLRIEALTNSGESNGVLETQQHVTTSPGDISLWVVNWGKKEIDRRS